MLVNRSSGTWEEQHRNEHGHLHQRGGDHSTEQFVHGFHGRLNCRSALFLLGSGVLHHRDGVIHHQTCGEHQAEQRELIQGEPEGQHKTKRADQRHGDCNGGHHRCFPVLEEQEQDQHHQNHGVPEGVGHTFDRLVDEVGDVKNLLNFQSHRKCFLELLNHFLHAIGDNDGVTAGQLVNRHTNGWISAKVEGINAVHLTAEADPADVLKPDQTTIISRSEDDVLKFFFCGQSALQLNRKREFLSFRSWSTTNLSCWYKTVLTAELRNNIIG